MQPVDEPPNAFTHEIIEEESRSRSEIAWDKFSFIMVPFFVLSFSAKCSMRNGEERQGTENNITSAIDFV